MSIIKRVIPQLFVHLRWWGGGVLPKVFHTQTASFQKLCLKEIFLYRKLHGHLCSTTRWIYRAYWASSAAFLFKSNSCGTTLVGVAGRVHRVEQKERTVWKTSFHLSYWQDMFVNRQGVTIIFEDTRPDNGEVFAFFFFSFCFVTLESKSPSHRVNTRSKMVARLGIGSWH